MILDLVKSDHPLLRTKMEKWDFTNPPMDANELANNLIETMVDREGLGLSANQCGLPYRMFVMWSNPTKVCINPRVVNYLGETIPFSEGCLSYPNLYVKIKRPIGVRVRYQTPDGETHTEDFNGMTARIFQHELDHLDGIVYTSRANKIHLDRAMRTKKTHDRIIKNTPKQVVPTSMVQRILEKANKENGSTT